MIALGPLAFAAPWALVLLAALPVIFWLLRLMPPAPRRVAFPGIALLRDLLAREETPRHAPWWLLLLRLAIAILIILGIARPIWQPDPGLAGSGPLLLVIDDGWSAAPGWSETRRAVETVLDRAGREGREVTLLTTAPPALGEALPETGPMPAEAALRRIRGLAPKPWPGERAGLPARIGALGLEGSVNSYWFSDGTAHEGDSALARQLQEGGRLAVFVPGAAHRPAMLTALNADPNGAAITATRLAAAGPAEARLRAYDGNGQALAAATLRFEDGAREASGRLELPPELRNRLSRVQIEDVAGAGAVMLADDSWRRRPVGIASARPASADRPLLTETYYLERALKPFAELHRGAVPALLNRELAVIMLPDETELGEEDIAALRRWTAAGGVLIRFAGPRLAAGDEAGVLTPVPLRIGERALGGALSWAQPLPLGPMPEDGPFAGLQPPEDVSVRTQVLAEPSIDLPDRTWAALADGTPLVTGRREGDGWVALFHVPAEPGWSDLPISGLFVEMLRRLSALSAGVSLAGEPETLPAVQVLDGYGQLTGPPAELGAIDGERLATGTPGPTMPPGYYGRPGALHAVNLTRRIDQPAAMAPLPEGVVRGLEGGAERPLAPAALLAALALLALDFILALMLRGLLPRPRRAAAAGLAAAMLLLGGMLAAPPGLAQTDAEMDEEEFILAATLSTRLAYVETGDPETDRIAERGLIGLSTTLTRRTAVEPGQPLAIDLERHDLRLFPLVFWAIAPDQPALSERARDNLRRYLASGGTLFIDTRDPSRAGETPLRRLLAGIDIPPLHRVPEDHVLGKAFYLLQEFPGRWTDSPVWLERGDGRINDGVSAIIIGGNDWIGAWAIDDLGYPLLPVVPGGERQRELSYRFGVNLVMHALTGNYKDDQVHVPYIVERLGQ